MKWAELTPLDRNRIIHLTLFHKGDEECTDRQLDPYMGDYWGCTCGWVSKQTINENTSTTHNKPIPRYSENMSDAWLVVEKMKSYGYTSVIMTPGGQFLVDLFSLVSRGGVGIDMIYDYTPELICIAALRANGHDIEP